MLRLPELITLPGVVSSAISVESKSTERTERWKKRNEKSPPCGAVEIGTRGERARQTYQVIDVLSRKATNYPSQQISIIGISLCRRQTR